MFRSFIDATPAAGTLYPHAVPLLLRTPTQRLIHAREDQEVCLRLAASYRVRMSRGEMGVRGMHVWAMHRAKVLRLRFPGMLAGERV